ncbi:hypothetical protein MTZ49_04675 [Entomomonas sp. E2T0]|uniref:hypothetical protein n=1 Tax=Entomomonas sp. E2T0 TaxID=2930213 RepID=UPI0022283688|nr:hypothetical protein [Entomomonas sp. E2T0]UYZ84865.1 hypothetical protein MTZ49_04675 [Entomomonas sp. E2T0]
MVKSNKQKRQVIKQKRLQKTMQSKPSFTKEQQLSYNPDYLVNFNSSITMDWSKLSDAMQQIIKKAYAIFSVYTAPEHFNVCTACCVSLEEEKALRTLPLSLLPRQLIYSYNVSAKSQQNNKSEVAYLLPRILELIALDEDIHHSTELNLTWLFTVSHELWTDQEKDLLAEFALQYLKDKFQQAEQNQKIVMIDEILIMFCSASINIEPLLDYMAQHSNFYIIASIAFLISWNKGGESYISNSFATNCPQINIIFNHWLEKNSILLQQNADHAILNPNTLSEHERTMYYIEQGLFELSHHLVNIQY